MQPRAWLSAPLSTIAMAWIGRAFALVLPVVAIAAATAISSGAAMASPDGAWRNYVVGGSVEPSCISARVCVLTGYGARGAEVQVVRDGVPGRVYLVRGLWSIENVACVPGRGCVAIGFRTLRGFAGERVVRISAAGRPVSSRALKIARGSGLLPVSCVSLTACTVVGWDRRGGTVGWWNGTTLHVHRVVMPRGLKFQFGFAWSCWGARCVGVADALRGSRHVGLIWPVRHGRPGRIRLAYGYGFHGVSCVSRSLCYVAGWGQGRGVIVALRNLVLMRPQHVRPNLFDIACSASGCTAAGVETAPPSQGGTTCGAITTVSSDGTVVAVKEVCASYGYQQVARAGRYFIAAGNDGDHPDTLITVG